MAAGRVEEDEVAISGDVQARDMSVSVLQSRVDITEWNGENIAEQVHGGGNNLVIT